MIAQEPDCTVDPQAMGIHCRTNEHARCSMVCACACHLIPRGTTWAALSASERGLVLIEGEG